MRGFSQIFNENLHVWNLIENRWKTHTFLTSNCFITVRTIQAKLGSRGSHPQSSVRAQEAPPARTDG